MDQSTHASGSLPAGATISGIAPSTPRRRPFVSAALFLVAMVAMIALGACGDNAIPAASATQTQPASALAPAEPTAAPTEKMLDGWQTFTSEADGFAIDTPGEPQASTRTTDSPLGEVTFHFFQLSDGDAQYGVSYNDYPVAAGDLDAKQLLTDAINGAGGGSEVQNVQAVDVQGHPAIDGETSLQDVAHLWYRGILVRERLYQLIVTAPEDNKAAFDDDARRFIYSFELLKP